jgi:hypothetical protein
VCTIHRSMHASAWGIDRAINWIDVPATRNSH